jgi:hypothetical protein
MHLVFERGGRFEATHIGGSTAITFQMDDKPYRTFDKVSDLGIILRKESGSRSINPDIIGVYFRPQEGNLNSVSSFVVTKSPTTSEPVLVLFQMTISSSHPVKSHVLASIWEVMPTDLKRTPPILVFVVPDDVAQEFSRQTIVASDDTPPVGSKSGTNTLSRSAAQHCGIVSNQRKPMSWRATPSGLG